MIATCEHCLSEYRTFPSWVKKGMRHCSKACAVAAKTRTLTCDWCGTTWQSVRRRIQEEQRFCSRPCADDARRLPVSRELIESSVRKEPDGCWTWLGSADRYGRMSNAYAHRVAYEVFVGPIPSGLTIDHLCFNTLCANPAHLEPVTQEENSRRYLVNKHWPEKRKARGADTRRALLETPQALNSGDSRCQV